jgi:hypothetical protein
MVGYSGLFRKVVAPNSPNEMLKAKTADTRMGPRNNGRSICIKTCQGFEPNKRADWFRDTGILLIDGCRIRTTIGNATKAWEIGRRMGNDIRYKDVVLNASTRPRPRVTAEVPNGSINIDPSNPLIRCGRLSANTTRMPKGIVTATVIRAKSTELRIAWKGGT